jgi:hypothetical protein
MPAAIRASWWPTPATGTSARSRRSLATASRCSSHRTQACAAARARDGPGASTTSCDAFATPHGRELYRQRQATIEPVFGQLKFNRDFRRFLRRGRAACRSAWRLIAATHNLLKLHRHRLTAATRTFPTASRESSGPTRRSRTAAWHMDRRGPPVAAACRESRSGAASDGGSPDACSSAATVLAALVNTPPFTRPSGRPVRRKLAGGISRA